MEAYSSMNFSRRFCSTRISKRANLILHMTTKSKKLKSSIKKTSAALKAKVPQVKAKAKSKASALKAKAKTVTSGKVAKVKSKAKTQVAKAKTTAKTQVAKAKTKVAAKTAGLASRVKTQAVAIEKKIVKKATALEKNLASKAEGVLHDAQSTLKDIKGKISEGYTDAVKSAKQAGAKVETAIKDHPIETAAIVAGVGAAVTGLLSGNNKKKNPEA